MPKARAKRSVAAEQLREGQARASAEKLFHDLLDGAPDAIVEVDSSGKIVRANATVEGLFGYSPSELLNQPVEKLIPEEARRVHARHGAWYSAHPTKRPMGSNLDLYGLRRDGSR
jgi:rsbT co-antagonist protein RsbR